MNLSGWVPCVANLVSVMRLRPSFVMDSVCCVRVSVEVDGSAVLGAAVTGI
jgi:hypothetical protein